MIPILVAVAVAGPAAWLATRVVAVWVGQRAPSFWALAAGFLALFAWGALAGPPAPLLAVSLGLAFVLACLAIVDLAVFRLPDPLTLPLIVMGLATAAFLPGRPVADHLVAAALGWSALSLIALAFRRLRNVDGIGPGDAKLLAAAGAWLGVSALPSVILIACAAAFVWVGVRAVARGQDALRDQIAFGAPLALATWVVWLHGPFKI
jgi:leader peptidase (prepilin peptidase)/N-methyltransferase